MCDKLWQYVWQTVTMCNIFNENVTICDSVTSCRIETLETCSHFWMIKVINAIASTWGLTPRLCSACRINWEVMKHEFFAGVCGFRSCFFLHLALYQVELYCLQNLLKLLISFILFISLLSIHLSSRLQSPFSCSPECFFVCRDLKKVTKAWKTISWMRLYYFGFHCGVGHVVLWHLCWMQHATDALCSTRYTSS